MATDFTELRRRILVALISDDELLDQLVLKGGNALELVYAINERASFDLDFSMANKFSDLAEAEGRIRKALEREFARTGIVVFDLSMEERPLERGVSTPVWWGGYQVTFKLVSRSIYDECEGDLDRVRRLAIRVGPLEKRIYKIDISCQEFCQRKERGEVDDYVVYAYSLEMIVIEKLRALCQQLPAYPYNRARSPRARDFFDISRVRAVRDIDLGTPENVELAEQIFAAKQVPMALLLQIEGEREFHRADWPSVVSSTRGVTKDFDVYFDEVISLIDSLKFAWKI